MNLNRTFKCFYYFSSEWVYLADVMSPHENNWISKHPFNYIEENCISSSTVSYNLIMFASVCLSNDFKGISHWRQIFRTQTQDPMTIVWSNRMANSLHIFILYIYNCSSYMLRIYLIIMFNRSFAFSFSFFLSFILLLLRSCIRFVSPCVSETFKYKSNISVTETKERHNFHMS